MNNLPLSVWLLVSAVLGFGLLVYLANWPHPRLEAWWIRFKWRRVHSNQARAMKAVNAKPLSKTWHEDQVRSRQR